MNHSLTDWYRQGMAARTARLGQFDESRSWAMSSRMEMASTSQPRRLGRSTPRERQIRRRLLAHALFMRADKRERDAKAQFINDAKRALRRARVRRVLGSR